MKVLNQLTLWAAVVFVAWGRDGGSPGSCEREDEPPAGPAMLQKKLSGSSTLTSVREEDGERAQQVSLAESQANARARVKLLVETDLGKLDATHFRSYRKEESCMDNANKAFDDIIELTGFDKELTAAELAAFRKRFVDELNYECKHDPEVAAHWIEDIQAAVTHERPVMTQALADSINNAHLAYQVAMQEWMVHESALSYQQRMGKKVTLERNASMTRATAEFYQSREMAPVEPPQSFSSSTKWPHCKEIFEKALNQGTCGSCWAFAALLTTDSRLCVATDGIYSGPRAQLSRGFVTSCANDRRDGCTGELPTRTYDLLAASGVPTGGSNGCKPYWGVGEGTDHFQSGASAPPCPSECEAKYGSTLADDLFVIPGIQHYREIFPNSLQATIDAKLSIMEHGPLSFGIHADHVFFGYSGGIFDHKCDVMANHEVVAYGWGPGYVLGMNSWGRWWGLKGGFKVADCKVTDWTIPGTIARDIASRLPPLFGQATQAPSPPTPMPGPPPWSVTGPCVVDKSGCVTSPNYPQPYGNHERCTIEKEFGRIKVMAFDTESVYDALIVNGKEYSGKAWQAPHGVVPTEDISWITDVTTTATGWRICPDAEPAPTPPPAPTPEPTPAPTPVPTTVAPQGEFSVAGLCKLHSDGCVTTPNFPSHYPSGRSCTIGKGFGKIRVVYFQTETCCDKLTVNGQSYSGVTGPHGVIPTTDIVWTPDNTKTWRGFKICPWVPRVTTTTTGELTTSPAPSTTTGKPAPQPTPWTKPTPAPSSAPTTTTPAPTQAPDEGTLGPWQSR